MVNWEYYKKPNSIDKDKALELITSSIPELKVHWDIYKKKEYTDYSTERNDYIDVGEVARYIVERIKAKKTDGFTSFFDSVETVLANGDGDTINLAVVGLLEDIQNISSGEKDIDYHTDFDIWLRPNNQRSMGTNNTVVGGGIVNIKKEKQQLTMYKRHLILRPSPPFILDVSINRKYK